MVTVRFSGMNGEGCQIKKVFCESNFVDAWKASLIGYTGYIEIAQLNSCTETRILSLI